MPMRKGDVIRHALNIVELMDAVSDAFMHSFVRPFDDPLIKPREIIFFDSEEVDEEPGRMPNLADIGLDDMGIQRIVIELSTDRAQFKIWAPYNEDFIAAIKRLIPKHARGWDRDERCWRVDTYWFGNAQQLLPKIYPHLERYYTTRAERMCEQLAKEDEHEEFDREGPNGNFADEQEPPKKKSKKKTTNYKKPKTQKKEGKFVDEEEPEPRARKSKSNGSKKSDDPYAVLGVSPDAPDEVVKAAHKALARMYHSDLGGDPKKMAQVNAAFETIKEQREWTK